LIAKLSSLNDSCVPVIKAGTETGANGFVEVLGSAPVLQEISTEVEDLPFGPFGPFGPSTET
jgi:hypothetical protein